ncbi:MAG TPA: pitrilysin family protein [Fimbriimonas sp.]
MSRSRHLILATAVLAASVSLAQDVPVEKYRLPNGMTVILHEDHTVPVVTVNTWFYVGSKDEPPGRSGFAHLFEHLMFMGTKRVPNGQFDEIMEAGGGSNNASTAEDRTNYFSTGPANLLPTLLWLDAERLEALGENIDQKKLDLQRDVVKNERRQGVENAPYGEAWESINGLVYPDNHPYHNSVIGTHDDLSAATVADVRGFFSTFYVPNNASLVVAGDFRSADVKPLIAELFGTLPRSNDPPRKAVPTIPPLGLKRHTMVDRVQQSQTIMVWHSPAHYQPGDAEMDLAAAVLTDGVNGRLYRDLVVDKKLATEVSAFQASRYHSSLFHIVATAAEGVALEKLEAAIDRVLREFLAKGPTAEELKRQSSKLEYGVLSSLQSIQAKADQMNQYEFYFGEPNSYRRDLDRYRKATTGGVRSAAAKTLDLDNRLILRVIPESETPAENPRDARPAATPPTGFTPPAPQAATLANGIKLYYFRRENVPLMTLSAQFLAGSASDAAGKAGQTSLMAEMLSEGAGPRSSAEFESALDLLGAHFGAEVDADSTIATLSVIDRNFDEALPLFADALLRPRFEAKEWERVQRVTAAALEQENDDPGAIARRVSLRELYGLSHPVGRLPTGTSVMSLNLQDIREAYARTIRQDAVAFFAAGSLPQEEVVELLNKAFAGWKASGAAPETPVFGPPANERFRVLIVDRPGAEQTTIRFLLPGTTYGDPNRHALAALGVALGGSFTSRLNQNLREDKGYTYGAGTGFVFAPEYGYVTATADVRADVTGASLKEFLAEFAKIRKGDVTAEEAGKAASSRRTDLVQSLASIQGLTGLAMEFRANGQPVDALGQELAAIGAVDAAKINAAAGSGLNLEKGVLVLVGDRNAILPQLEGLGLPEPTVVEP